MEKQPFNFNISECLSVIRHKDKTKEESIPHDIEAVLSDLQDKKKVKLFLETFDHIRNARSNNFFKENLQLQPYWQKEKKYSKFRSFFNKCQEKSILSKITLTSLSLILFWTAYSAISIFEEPLLGTRLALNFGLSLIFIFMGEQIYKSVFSREKQKFNQVLKDIRGKLEVDFLENDVTLKKCNSIAMTYSVIIRELKLDPKSINTYVLEKVISNFENTQMSVEDLSNVTMREERVVKIIQELKQELEDVLKVANIVRFKKELGKFVGEESSDNEEIQRTKKFLQMKKRELMLREEKLKKKEDKYRNL